VTRPGGESEPTAGALTYAIGAAAEPPPALVGGKAASVDRLARLGFATPGGFCLTSAAHCAYRESAGLVARFDELRGRLPDDDARSELAAVARAAPLPQSTRAALAESIDALRATMPAGARLAVRSSATDEDGRGASFAGAHESVLGVACELDAVEEAIRTCWSSMWSRGAVTYRYHHELGYGAEMAVLVQELVHATASAVVFTEDPVTGSTDEMLVSTGDGFGEDIMAGGRDALTFRIDRATRAVLDVDGPGGPWPVSLATVDRLVELALAVERAHNVSVDVEAAFDGREWILLQARSITTRAATPAPRNTAARGPAGGAVRTGARRAETARGRGPVFEDDDTELLLELLRTPTTTPIETGRPSQIPAAQRLLAERAAHLGFEIVLHEPPPIGALDEPDIPLGVLEAAESMGREEFLACQPNMVLRLGPERGRDRTLMTNAHLDTVGGEVSVGVRDGVISGRGAVDMKGPAVAVFAGIRAALYVRPDLSDRVTVLAQLVAGEEAGAMGTYGTRVLVRGGLIGRLNVFAEPTGGQYFDACTASMTARVRVRGTGSTDDAPEAGENATLLLGHIATQLASCLDGVTARAGGKLCVGGLSTGTMHDRVYGEGDLLVNLAYPSAAAAVMLEQELEQAVRGACAAFADRFAGIALARRTALAAEHICRVEWLKRGLPPLAGRDPELEPRLARIGIERVPESRASERFTCDAIWCSPADGYTIVFGPGRLGENGAHSSREHVCRPDLERYASALARLLLDFDDRAAERGA